MLVLLRCRFCLQCNFAQPQTIKSQYHQYRAVPLAWPGRAGTEYTKDHGSYMKSMVMMELNYSFGHHIMSGSSQNAVQKPYLILACSLHGWNSLSALESVFQLCMSFHCTCRVQQDMFKVYWIISAKILFTNLNYFFIH